MGKRWRINAGDLWIQEILFILLPVFPLLDFFSPYKIPYLSILVYMVLLGMFCSKDFKYYLALIAYVVVNILSIFLSIVFYGLNTEQLYYIMVLLTFSTLGIGIGGRENRYINILYRMMFLYFVINTCIYFFRLIQYGFDISRVRGGVAIYGGNSAHFIYLTLLFLLKQHKEKKQSYYRALMICVINAVMFVSKGAMIITFIWILLDIVNHKDSKIFDFRNVIMAFIIIVLFFCLCFYRPQFLSYIANRFVGWNHSFQKSGSIMGERGQIFKFTIDYIRENPIFLFFGIGSTNYKIVNPWGYSNPHNLFLDVLINDGVFCLTFFLCIVLKTLWHVQYKFYYMLCIIYATLEGVALFYVDESSCIMTGYAFMFLIIIFISSKTQINERHKQKIRNRPSLGVRHKRVPWIIC